MSVGMPPSEVTEKLQLHKLKDRVWNVVPSCATTGEGLFEGLVSNLFLFHSRTSRSFTLLPQGWLSNNVKTQAPARK